MSHRATRHLLVGQRAFEPGQELEGLTEQQLAALVKKGHAAPIAAEAACEPVEPPAREIAAAPPVGEKAVSPPGRKKR